jgi:hypothetical protein
MLTLSPVLGLQAAKPEKPCSNSSLLALVERYSESDNYQSVVFGKGNSSLMKKGVIKMLKRALKETETEYERKIVGDCISLIDSTTYCSMNGFKDEKDSHIPQYCTEFEAVASGGQVIFDSKNLPEGESEGDSEEDTSIIYAFRDSEGKITDFVMYMPDTYGMLIIFYN